MNITKCLKVILAKHMIIIPFDGNLTSAKKNDIAQKIQPFLNTKFKTEVSVNDVLVSVFHKAYGSVEKNLLIDNHGERSSFTGQGWASTNMPNENYTILQ